MRNNKINLLPRKTQGGEGTKVVRIKKPPYFGGAMIIKPPMREWNGRGLHCVVLVTSSPRRVVVSLGCLGSLWR